MITLVGRAPWHDHGIATALVQGVVATFLVEGEAGGVMGNGPGPETGRYLTMGEREEIAVGRAAGQSVAVIAAALGRPRCTIYRELGRNSGAAGYRATIAQRRTDQRRRRPKQ